MNTYAVGDIQGCLDDFIALLDVINFNSSEDQLWLCGDLINRGPDSLKTLEYVQTLNPEVLILGNHDLYFLCAYYGGIERVADDTLDALFTCKKVDELAYFLQTHGRLAHYDKTLNALITHAGILPGWTLESTLGYAEEIHTVLHDGGQAQNYFAHLYGNTPLEFSSGMKAVDRWRLITNAFTRIRMVDESGLMEFNFKGHPNKAPEHLMPWFSHPNFKCGDINILFGHWAALQCETPESKKLHALDSGCVWGGPMTALRLEDKTLFHSPQA